MQLYSWKSSRHLLLYYIKQLIRWQPSHESVGSIATCDELTTTHRTTTMMMIDPPASAEEVGGRCGAPGRGAVLEDLAESEVFVGE